MWKRTKKIISQCLNIYTIKQTYFRQIRTMQRADNSEQLTTISSLKPCVTTGGITFDKTSPGNSNTSTKWIKIKIRAIGMISMLLVAILNLLVNISILFEHVWKIVNPKGHWVEWIVMYCTLNMYNSFFLKPLSLSL